MTITHVSSIISAQVLFRGRAFDALTNTAPRNRPAVTLFYQTPPGQPQRPYPLAPRVYADGTFVFGGDPNRALPQPVAGETLDLRLTISALGYQIRSFDFSLDENDLGRTEVDRELNGRTEHVRLLDTPLWEQDVALDPIPVHLYGRVVHADDMDTPIENAQVRLTAPETRGPFATDANGAFAILDLPLALQVSVRITRAGFATLEDIIHLDYRRPINQHQFALE
jgi:hypothetical protein